MRLVYPNSYLDSVNHRDILPNPNISAPRMSLLPVKSHGQRSLVGCSPWGHWGSDTIERLHFHFSLSCTGEGNGNPLQCSCLENPKDGEAWWAAVYGVAQSRTQLKRLSSSRMSLHFWYYKNVCHITSCTSWSGKMLSSDLFVGSAHSFFLANLEVSQVLSLHKAFPGNFEPHCFFPDLTLKSQSLFFFSPIWFAAI